MFGTWIAPNFSINEKYPNAFPEYPLDSGVEAVRLLLKVQGGTSTRWTLTFRDPQYRVLLSLGPSDFTVPLGGGPAQRWTGLLKTGLLKLNLTSHDGRDVEVKVASGLAYPKAGPGDRQFSVQGPKETWEPLYKSGDVIAKQVGDSVGFLASAGQVGAQKASWCCSGVMLSSDIFLTNWHCGGAPGFQDTDYWGQDVCANTLVDLSWDDSLLRRQFACKTVLLLNRPLDFALLRLEPIVGTGNTSGEPRPAALAGNPANGLKKDDQLFMVHHAVCKEKLVSNKCYVKSAARSPWRSPTGQTGENAIAGSAATDFTHSCDTEPGASGAPVFNVDGKIVGLHHLGFEYDNQCKPDKDNKAVHIEQILEVILREKPEIAREIGKN